MTLHLDQPLDQHKQAKPGGLSGRGDGSWAVPRLVQQLLSWSVHRVQKHLVGGCRVCVCVCMVTSTGLSPEVLSWSLVPGRSPTTWARGQRWQRHPKATAAENSSWRPGSRSAKLFPQMITCPILVLLCPRGTESTVRSRASGIERQLVFRPPMPLPSLCFLNFLYRMFNFIS